MKVKDLMTTNLITIDVNSPLRTALKLMKKHRVTRLIVTRHGKIDGIVTERDLVNRLGKEKEAKLSDAHIYVSSCYSKNPITITADEDVKEAAKLMLSKGISSLLVKQDDRIVGIITKTDFIKALKECNKPIKEVMTNRVVYLPSSSRLVEARNIMLHEKIKKILVVDDGKLVGIVTEKDIARALGLFRKLAEGTQWDERMRRIKLRDIMRSPVITVGQNESVCKAVKIMLEKKISGLPVFNGKLTGIITKTDLIRAIAKE